MGGRRGWGGRGAGWGEGRWGGGGGVLMKAGAGHWEVFSFLLKPQGLVRPKCPTSLFVELYVILPLVRIPVYISVDYSVIRRSCDRVQAKRNLLNINVELMPYKFNPTKLRNQPHA